MGNQYYEWDDAKNITNILKHGVSFSEAEEAFSDPYRIIARDEQHSVVENRWFCYGRSSRGILTVRFTIRNKNIRIIGAGYWRQGKAKYERKNNER